MAQLLPAATIIVPAHNEEATIGRLLGALTDGARPGEFDIVVVCNGCSDATAATARTFAEPAGVRVIELSQPSKAEALRAGRRSATVWPIAFVDADVLVDVPSMRAMVGLLDSGRVLATAPQRRLSRERVSAPANWYYDVWERLPQVRTGLFGRGVIVLSREGAARTDDLAAFVADDLAYSASFAPGERAVTPEASVTVWPARTWRALVHRRVRAVQGVRELRTDGTVPVPSQTSPADLARIVRREPAMGLRMPVFLATTLAARLLARRARRRGDHAWNRDETSRR